jgi:hypothetical protein
MPEVSRRSSCAAAGKESGTAAGAAVPSDSGPTARLANRHLTSAPASDPCNWPAVCGWARRRRRDGDGARPRPVRSAPTYSLAGRRHHRYRIAAGSTSPCPSNPARHVPLEPRRSPRARGTGAPSDGRESCPESAGTQGIRTDVHPVRRRRPALRGSARLHGRRRQQLLPERTHAP